MPSGKWNRKEGWLQPCFTSNGSEKLLVGIDPRTAAFDGDWPRFRPLQSPHDGLGYILHINRLQPCQAASSIRKPDDVGDATRIDHVERHDRREHHDVLCQLAVRHLVGLQQRAKRL